MKRLCKNLLLNKNVVILDTETTGLRNNDEVIQLGIIDIDGAVLMDTFIQPTRAKISHGAMAVHNITHTMLEGAPTLGELAEQLTALLDGKTTAVYNASFDQRLLMQTAVAAGSRDLVRLFSRVKWIDLMGPYAAMRRSRWVSLKNACAQQRLEVKAAHTAVGDCQLVLALMRKMAGIHV